MKSIVECGFVNFAIPGNVTRDMFDHFISKVSKSVFSLVTSTVHVSGRLVPWACTAQYKYDRVCGMLKQVSAALKEAQGRLTKELHAVWENELITVPNNNQANFARAVSFDFDD